MVVVTVAIVPGFHVLTVLGVERQDGDGPVGDAHEADTVHNELPETSLLWTSARLVRIADGTVTVLPFDAEDVRSMKVSNDGNLVTTTTADGSLWIYDSRRQTRTSLPEGAVRSRIAPSWSPDNRRIAFFSAMVGYHLYVQPVDGVSDPQGTFGGPEEKGAGAFTPDGQSYVFTYHKATATGSNLFRIRLAANQQPERLTKSTASETSPAFSPDGKWLAYTANDTGRFEVFLQPYPELDRRVQVSTSGGSVPRWSPDSGTLFYGSGATSVRRSDPGIGRERDRRPAAGGHEHPGRPRRTADARRVVHRPAEPDRRRPRHRAPADRQLVRRAATNRATQVEESDRSGAGV